MLAVNVSSKKVNHSCLLNHTDVCVIGHRAGGLSVLPFFYFLHAVLACHMMLHRTKVCLLKNIKSQRRELFLAGNANDLAASSSLHEKTLIPMIFGNQERNTLKVTLNSTLFSLVILSVVKMMVKINFLVQKLCRLNVTCVAFYVTRSAVFQYSPAFTFPNHFHSCIRI